MKSRGTVLLPLLGGPVYWISLDRVETTLHHIQPISLTSLADTHVLNTALNIQIRDLLKVLGYQLVSLDLSQILGDSCPISVLFDSFDWFPAKFYFMKLNCFWNYFGLDLCLLSAYFYSFNKSTQCFLKQLSIEMFDTFVRSEFLYFLPHCMFNQRIKPCSEQS